MLRRLFYWISWPILFLYARIMLKYDVFKMESFPDGPKIFVANHPSTIDPFFLAFMVSQPVHILITDMVFKIPVAGKLLRKWGHIPVVQGEGYKALDEAIALIKSGKSIALFPEGNISPNDGGFHKPRTGAARLALATGAAVIPVGIHISRERIKHVPSVIGGRETVTKWYFRGPYHMTSGKALRFNGNVEDRKKVVDASRNIMDQIIYLAEISRSRMLGINGPLLIALD
ncbi:MAG: 1-acyl-sn-glycerol-3-phosphate acyltransferase [Anaerolineaceae bacterium]|nr:1-acyl-sn-glycerol-3-phosphate acyltransferase [Anaerolineaceae bacterium]